MRITDVRIRKTFEEGPLKAIVSVTFDDALAVHDIKIVEVKNDKRFVVMPSVKMPDGTYRDTVHPMNSEFRLQLTEAILARYAVHCAVKEVSHKDK
jgi:stage V sporulation protein G